MLRRCGSVHLWNSQTPQQSSARRSSLQERRSFQCIPLGTRSTVFPRPAATGVRSELHESVFSTPEEAIREHQRLFVAAVIADIHALKEEIDRLQRTVQALQLQIAEYNKKVG